LYSATYGSPQVRALTRASRAFLAAPPAGFAAHPLLAPRGALVFGGAAQEAQVRAAYESMRPHTRDLELWDAARIRAAVPVMRPEAAQLGFYEPGAADIDVNELHQGFLRGLRAQGGSLLLDVRIEAIEHTLDGWELALADGRRLRAPLLADAAGAWADPVAVQAGVPPSCSSRRRASTPRAGRSSARWTRASTSSRTPACCSARRPTPIRCRRTTCSRRSTTWRWASTASRRPPP
jgi:D-arginine dehydrogenase